MRLYNVVAASATILLTAATAQAAQIAVLVGDNTIVIVDTAAKKVTKTWTISGITGRVAGIDVRPADGMLYALAANGNIYTVDVTSGISTMKSKLTTMLPNGVTASVDFNPVADRLRIIGSDGTNLRVNVDDGKAIEDGKLRYSATDPNNDKIPRIAAAAYTNSVKGAKETTLYDIDTATAALVRQVPPNDGVLNTVGVVGKMTETLAFDIWSDGKGGNDAWLMVSAGLHHVDLMTGKADAPIKIDGVKVPIRDIAILPSM